MIYIFFVSCTNLTSQNVTGFSSISATTQISTGTYAINLRGGALFFELHIEVCHVRIYGIICYLKYFYMSLLGRYGDSGWALGFTVFAEVIEGMDVADRISHLPTTEQGGLKMLTTPVCAFGKYGLYLSTVSTAGYFSCEQTTVVGFAQYFGSWFRFAETFVFGCDNRLCSSPFKWLIDLWSAILLHQCIQWIRK